MDATQALMASALDSLPNKAGTSSCGVLRGILSNPADLQQLKVRPSTGGSQPPEPPEHARTLRLYQVCPCIS